MTIEEELEWVKRERDDHEQARAALEEAIGQEMAEKKAERERADALAAHVERLRNCLGECHHHACYSIGESAALAVHKAKVRILAYQGQQKEIPAATSLARCNVHPDDEYVDRFADAMKTKMSEARAKGRDGWNDPEQCSASFLAELLVGHVGKGNAGNLEDIANLTMMLHQRGDSPSVVAQASDQRDARMKAQAMDEANDFISAKMPGARRVVREMAERYRQLAREVDGNEFF